MQVRRTIADLDPELPVLAVRTLEDYYVEDNEPLRMIAQTAGGLGIVALLLAVSGLYSVIAFFVALRTSEFGIRVALGARSADIVRMVLGQALRLAGLGLARRRRSRHAAADRAAREFPVHRTFRSSGHSAGRPRARPDRSFRGMGAGSQSVLDSGVGSPPGRLGVDLFQAPRASQSAVAGPPPRPLNC